MVGVRGEYLEVLYVPGFPSSLTSIGIRITVPLPKGPCPQAKCHETYPFFYIISQLILRSSHFLIQFLSTGSISKSNKMLKSLRQCFFGSQKVVSLLYVLQRMHDFVLLKTQNNL